MLNISHWCLGSLLVLVAMGSTAEEQEKNIVLTAEFLQYLAEFSDGQGEVIDPELLSELIYNPQIDTAQKSLESSQEKPGAMEEVKP
jgi:hypothetical protein